MKNSKRLFTKMIFLGTSNSINEVEKLHFRVEEGIRLLAGIQQPDSITELPNKNRTQEDEKDFEDIKDIIRDVIEAFGFESSIVKLEQKSRRCISCAAWAKQEAEMKSFCNENQHLTDGMDYCECFREKQR